MDLLSDEASQVSSIAVSQIASTGKQQQFFWTDAMCKALLEAQIHQVRLGKRSDSGFKKSVWTLILEAIQPCIQQTYADGSIRRITQSQASTKTSEFKSFHSEWRKLLEVSGFGKDPETGCITADDAVWDRYLEVS